MTHYTLLAQTTDLGPTPILTGTEQEVKDACQVAKRNLLRHGVGGYYAPEVRDFAIGHPTERPRIEPDAALIQGLLNL